MPLKIEADRLAGALKSAAAIVEAKSTLPLLAMVRLIAEGDTLEVMTSNLDIEYRQVIAAVVDEPFSCCVDAKRLAAMAIAADGKKLVHMTMALDGNILTIKAGRSKWAAPSLPIDDFPIMPVDKLSPAMKVDNLAIIAKRTAWTVSTEVHRAFLSGVYLNNEAGMARWVATDGYQLASVITETKWPKSAPDVIVPAPMIKAMAGAAGNETAKLEWDATKLRFTSGSVTITGKMIEGGFPDYRRIIPSVDGPSFTVDAAELEGAVVRVRIASDAKQRGLWIKQQNAALLIRIEGTSGFEGEEEIAAECDEGHECCLNADILAAMLSAMDAETIIITQKEDGAPIFLRPSAHPEGIVFAGLIMPIRI